MNWIIEKFKNFYPPIVGGRNIRATDGTAQSVYMYTFYTQYIQIFLCIFNLLMDKNANLLY